jgi:flavin reductase (DIM6/NTAB) family NADH-FMN oxidoreductase RutF
MPTGLYLLGSRWGEERNLMTVSLVAQVCVDPKLVAVSVERVAHTHRLIEEGGVFALSVVSRDDRAVVRRFVKPAAWDGEASTLNGHVMVEATTGAPILGAAVSFLDCELRQTLALGTHSLFVGEVVDAGFLGDESSPILRMEDTRMSYGG